MAADFVTIVTLAWSGVSVHEPRRDNQTPLFKRTAPGSSPYQLTVTHFNLEEKLKSLAKMWGAAAELPWAAAVPHWLQPSAPSSPAAPSTAGSSLQSGTL